MVALWCYRIARCDMLPSGETVAVSSNRFDRGREGTKLLAQRSDDDLDFIRTRKGSVPDLAKHLVATEHASIRLDQRLHHAVLQTRGRLAAPRQDELARRLVQPTV